jgi:hypothetical protein
VAEVDADPARLCRGAESVNIFVLLLILLLLFGGGGWYGGRAGYWDGSYGLGGGLGLVLLIVVVLALLGRL